MRSLVIKLTLAFLLVGLTGSVLVAIIVQQRTQREFDQLIKNQNQDNLVIYLGEYYEINGSWAGVETVFRAMQRLTTTLPAIQAPQGEPHFDPRRSLFTLADVNGRVIYGHNPAGTGDIVPKPDLDKGVPIEVNGAVAGWLLFNPALDRWRPGTPEGNFLASVNNAVLVSAIVASVTALVMGGILAFTMTRSLRELTAGTRQLAEGKLGHQVKVHSKDELGELANSFNQMSAALAHSNELRRQMTADIAHDLRTPLSVILGYTEALSDQKLEPGPEMFTVMHREALHLSHLVADLKTLSLADAGELPLNIQPIAPQELLLRTLEAHRVKAESKGIHLQVDAPEDLPLISIDVDRMAQVLGNLMANALRYTPSGGEIRLEAESNGNCVCLSVSDSGPGIPLEDIPYIFERSYRGDRARHQQEGETGLGLAIARSLVIAQGGTISVESSKGQGATFTLKFPVGGTQGNGSSSAL
jgi:two-component system sensor histidine kinase BaeS